LDTTRITTPEAVLTSHRLCLRHLVPTDAAALHLVSGDPEAMRFWHPGPDATVADSARRIAEIEAHWERHGYGDLAVITRSDGELIGFAGLHHIADMEAVNVGHVLRPDRWRQGLGTELCRTLLEWGLDTLGLSEVVAVIDPRNTTSLALAERCGLTRRQRFLWQGRERLLYGVARVRS
jgi:ribosomal-protein-alanine N-acetyltransferase